MRLPRIGVVRSKEKTSGLLALVDAGGARILHATLSETTGRWFCSFCIEVGRDDPPAQYPEAVAGVDLGVRHLAVCSSGEFFENPKALNRYGRMMARLQRELSRRRRGSKRRAMTKRHLATLHHRVADTRRDALHQLSATRAANYGTVVIEDLAVANLTASAKGRGRRQKAGLNRAILDTAPRELRRQLAYKMAWHGGRLIVADRFFPSSKLCSSCGEARAKLSLSTRTYHCAHCGVVIDRDLNAALNLAALANDVAGGSPETRNGRGGDEGSGRSPVLPSETSRRQRATAQDRPGGYVNVGHYRLISVGPVVRAIGPGHRTRNGGTREWVLRATKGEGLADAGRNRTTPDLFGSRRFHEV